VRNKKLPTFKNLLSQAIELGGIYHNVEGNDIYSVFENSLDIFTFITHIKKDKILEELLNREEFASTGIGKGIAIPHSRDRLKIGLHETYVPVIFLKNAIEYNSVDSMPVQVLFMIFTADTTSHLQILSKISYCLKNSELLSVIENKNKDNNLIDLIFKIENAL
jgi:PTS system nitrogen regulatory IIA component